MASRQKPPRYGWLDLVYSPECSLSDTDRLVATVLFIHMDAGGRCWPSAATIARRLGKCERSVRRSIASLKEAGLVTVPDKRPVIRNGSGFKVNIYQAMIPPVTGVTGIPLSKNTNPPVKSDLIPLSPVSPKPTKKPIKEQRPHCRAAFSSKGKKELEERASEKLGEQSNALHDPKGEKRSSAVQESLKKPNPRKPVECLAEKKGGPGDSPDGELWHGTLIRRLMSDLGEEAGPRLKELYEIHGKVSVDIAAVLTLNEPNFHEALTARLGEQNELASQPTEETR